MSVFYEFNEVDAFTAGAIGPPGQRVFFLQARSPEHRVAIRCEKQQVAAIVEYLRRVLVDLPPAEDKPVADSLELTVPVDEVFVLGPIGLGYDRSRDRVIVQLEEVTASDDEEASADDEEHTGQVRVFLTRAQAAAFCEHAEQVVAAGRATCRWCELPIDPEGHACPRLN